MISFSERIKEYVAKNLLLCHVIINIMAPVTNLSLFERSKSGLGAGWHNILVSLLYLFVEFFLIYTVISKKQKFLFKRQAILYGYYSLALVFWQFGFQNLLTFPIIIRALALGGISGIFSSVLDSYFWLIFALEPVLLTVISFILIYRSKTSQLE